MSKTKKAKKVEAKALSISHPNSRKALKLAKEAIREAARKKTAKEFAIRRNIFGQKLLWFKENLEPKVTVYTGEMFDALIEKYLSRFDEELEQINIKHSIGKRKGRQHASREDIIKMTKSRDTEEYLTSGIEMVNILNPRQLEIFQEWDADINKLHNFNIKRFSKNFLKNYKPSQNIVKRIEADINARSEEGMVISEDS